MRSWTGGAGGCGPRGGPAHPGEGTQSLSHREPRVGGELRSSPDPARKHLQPQVLREPCAESRQNLHGHREVPAPPHGPARWHCPEATSQRGTGPGEVPQPTRDHAASGVGEVGTRASSSPNSAEDMLLRNLPPLSWRRGAGPPADAGNQTPGRSRRSTASGGRGAASAAGLPAKPGHGRREGRWGGLHSQAAARRSHLSAHLSAHHQHRQPAGSWSSPPGVSRCRAQR